MHESWVSGYMSNGPAGLRWFGGLSERVTPDPIPNSAVKVLSADGTSS